MLRRATRRTFVVAGLLAMAGCASGFTKAGNESMRAVRVLPPDASPVPVADGLPAGFRVAFADADARARALVYYQQCTATVLQLRSRGTFGAAASAPKAVYCERTAAGVPIGGVFDIDSAFTRPRRLTMIRLDGTRPRYAEAIDTARVLREARLLRDATRDMTPVMRKLGRAFTLAPVTAPGGSSDVWVLPSPAWNARSAILGGDIALTRGADGRLTRTLDRSASRRVLPLPATGVVQLSSAEPNVPAVADLMLARSLAERGRDVVVTTAAARSQLVPDTDPSTGSRFSWTHTRVSP